MNAAKLIKVFKAKQKLYQRDPVLFAKEVVGYKADVWQADTLRDLADPECRRVSVRSGQGVGKTATEAVALLWFLSCFPFARVVATAPTRQQLNDVLWSEIAKWQAKSPMLNAILRWTKTYVFMTGMEKRWFAVARTATKPENMQGFHEENMLFIVDEASGVAEPIMEAILGTLSGPNNKLLLCGNPTKTSGTFYDSHTNAKIRPLYRSRRVSSRDVARTDKENIEMLERRYGKESNVVRVRVDGEFPLQCGELIQAAQKMRRVLAGTTSVSRDKALRDLVEEAADVVLILDMLAGLKLVDRAGMRFIGRYKNERWFKRIVVLGKPQEDKPGECIDRQKLLENVDAIWDCNDMVFEGDRDHACHPEDCKGCHWYDTKQYIRKLIANASAVVVKKGG